MRDIFQTIINIRNGLKDYFEAGKKRLDVHRAQLQIY